MAPGALYAAQGIEALRELGRGPVVSLTDVQIQRPLVLSGDEGRTVQVVLGSEDRWEVVSRGGKEAAWELHAEGRLAEGLADGSEEVDIEELREGLLPVDARELYRRLAAEGSSSVRRSGG